PYESARCFRFRCWRSATNELRDEGHAAGAWGYLGGFGDKLLDCDPLVKVGEQNPREPGNRGPRTGDGCDLQPLAINDVPKQLISAVRRGFRSVGSNGDLRSCPKRNQSA